MHALAISRHPSAFGATVFDPRGKYRETRCPIISAAVSPISVFPSAFLLRVAVRGAHVRATVCLRSTPPRYSRPVPAAQKSCCLLVQRSHACLPQFFAAERISSTRRVARIPRCCADRGQGAMPPAAPLLRAKTASDLDHAMCVFHRPHGARQERESTASSPHE